MASHIVNFARNSMKFCTLLRLNVLFPNLQKKFLATRGPVVGIWGGRVRVLKCSETSKNQVPTTFQESQKTAQNMTRMY